MTDKKAFGKNSLKKVTFLTFFEKIYLQTVDFYFQLLSEFDILIIFEIINSMFYHYKLFVA